MRTFVPVEMNTEVTPDGRTKLIAMILPDGRFVKIDRVLHYAVSHEEFRGIRYTALISGEERYIYKSGNKYYFLT